MASWMTMSEEWFVFEQAWTREGREGIVSASRQKGGWGEVVSSWYDDGRYWEERKDSTRDVSQKCTLSAPSSALQQ